MSKKYYVAVRLLDYLGRVVTGPVPLDVCGDETGGNDVYYYDSPFEAYAAAKFFKPARDNGIYMYRCVYNVVTVDVRKEVEREPRWKICARQGKNSAVMYAPTFNQAWGKIIDLGRVFDTPEVSISKQVEGGTEKEITVQLGTDFTRGGVLRLLKERGLQ